MAEARAVATRPPALERLVLGVGGGALLALALGFAVSALGVDFAQTGGSPGKWLFLVAWLGWAAYCWLEPRGARALAASVFVPGCLCLVAAAAWLALGSGSGGAQIEIALVVIGVGLCEAGRRLYRRQPGGSSR